MKVAWKESTRDRHCAQLPHGAVLHIERSRQWKKLGHQKPWRIVAFGNNFVCRDRFADLAEAKAHAEKLAIEIVSDLAKSLGCQLA